MVQTRRQYHDWVNTGMQETQPPPRRQGTQERTARAFYRPNDTSKRHRLPDDHAYSEWIPGHYRRVAL